MRKDVCFAVICCACGMILGAMMKDIYVLLYNGILLIVLAPWNK